MTRYKHGTRSSYVGRNCRCKRCVQANRDYQLAYMHKRKEAGIVNHHGKRLDRC